MTARPPPGLGDPAREALPLHLRATAAGLLDDLPYPPPPALGDAAAAAVAAERDRLATVVPAGTELTIDAYRVRQAAMCPASASGGVGFRWTPAGAARHLGLRALALSVCGDAGDDRPAPRPVEQAVRDVISELVRSGGDRTPGPWLASLGPAGRAVAVAQAQRWAEQAVAWLPLRLLGPRSLRFLDDDWWPGGVAGRRTLVLHGRRDLTLDLGGVWVGVTLASGGAKDPGAADADALGALAATLCDPRGRLVRVVRVHPASGEVVAVDVTADLLDRGVAAVLRTASALASAAVGVEVATRPSAACTWCDRLAGCRPGATEVGRPDPRSMGLPVPRFDPTMASAGSTSSQP